jgi:hypothetical protein
MAIRRQFPAIRQARGAGWQTWGSGTWQYDLTTTVDFDWVAYGNNF